MNKEEFLKIFSDKEIANRLFEDLQIAINYETVVNSEIFVNMNIWKKLNKEYINIECTLEGYDKKQICFHPKNIHPFFDYSVLKIEVNNKFKNYTHRDFLGSIMALNIKRDYIGDIFVEDNIAYVYVSNKILDFLVNNLVEVGKNEVKIEITDRRDFEFKFDEEIINVSSNRLDNFISKIIKSSRNDAIEYISSSLVKIDDDICKEKDFKIYENMNISIRGYGKYIVSKKLENSKKGKERYSILKYI